MSLSEVSASVSALLGFAPPSTLTADGSSKVFFFTTLLIFLSLYSWLKSCYLIILFFVLLLQLNKILKPNPFERPRAAFVLEIAGADGMQIIHWKA